MIRASIDEAAVADAQIIQPGLGWVPLWRSRSYPVTDHLAWVAANTGATIESIQNGLLQYVRLGGDIVGVFVEHCRAIGRHPIPSLRLNDTQVLINVDNPMLRQSWVSRFYVDNPEYRLGGNLHNINRLALNWAIPAVRNEKFAFIAEIIDGYDISGIEIDFMRSSVFFRSDQTSSYERRSIMTAFVAEVRRYLDQKTGWNRTLTLCVRIPAIVDFHDEIGIDIASLAEAGVDVFTLSNSYFTSQRADVEAARAAAPRAQLFLEMTHTSAQAPDPDIPGDLGLNRTTDLQFLTTAHEMIARGGDGVALFNFAYYRKHAPEDPTEGKEPPFHLLPTLAAPRTIPPGPRWWFVAKGWGRRLSSRNDWLPRWATSEYPLEIDFYSHRPQQAGFLRVRSLKPLAPPKIHAKLNGFLLSSSDDYRAIFGEIDSQIGSSRYDSAFYSCPIEAVRYGNNTLSLWLTEGRVQIFSFDLIFVD